MSKKYNFTIANRESQIEFLTERLEQCSSWEPNYNKLSEILKEHVEEEKTYLVPMPESKIDLLDLINNSKFFELEDFEIQFKYGKVSGCHENSFLLVLEKPNERKLMTGYALSEDHLWRQHSWVQEGNIIIETTEPRLAYYGYEGVRLFEEYILEAAARELGRGV